MKITSVTIKDFIAKTSQNLTWLFFGVFVLLLILEAFVIKSSVDVALNLNNPPENVKTEKGVRINFPEYETALKRIKAADNFRPSGDLTNDPFYTPPATSPTPVTLP